MARRGLVSKGMGQGPSSGGSALMPKGEKPKGPQLLPVAEVARRLRVQPSQVEGWLEKGQMRGDAQGVRPYDFKKFQLDNPELIQRAKQEAVQEKSTQGKRKPKKSLLSKFKSLFGGNDGADSGDATLAKENKRLKEQLNQLQKTKKSSGGKGEGTDLEEKVRYLEGKLTETRALESEVSQLRKQLSEQQHVPATAGFGDGVVSHELEEMRARLAEAERQSRQGERFREALTLAQQERDELLATIQELKQRPPEGTGSGDELSAEFQKLQSALAQREHELSQAEQNLQQISEENERLRQSPQQSPSERPAQDNALVEELLNLQRINLKRFSRLRSFYEESLSQPQQGGADPAELQELRAKYEALLASQDSGSETQEVMEQLSESRAVISKLKEENSQLKQQLESSQDADSRIQELEEKLQAAEQSDADYHQVEAELKSLRKAMEAKENQIQKVSSRLNDNEKRLSKAMGESARLTELLIERESRLRELSEEFEQEYRDKLENLDRQVSGLQWKLSLREERIAHLEGELQRKN